MEEFESDQKRFSKLTAKQKECLHLVVQRKSSKEIARILNISKPAVDQRLDSARRTLGVTNRDQAAIMFARLSEDYNSIIYDSAYIPNHSQNGADLGLGTQLGDFVYVKKPEDKITENSGVFYDKALQSLNASAGTEETFRRIAIIIGLTIAILVTVLIGLAVSQTLSTLLAG